jgi:hypothetical protein
MSSSIHQLRFSLVNGDSVMTRRPYREQLYV